MDLIAAVADNTDLSKAKATEVVEAVFGAIGEALKAREEVRLVGFGSFTTAIPARARKSRSPPRRRCVLSLASFSRVP